MNSNSNSNSLGVCICNSLGHMQFVFAYSRQKTENALDEDDMIVDEIEAIKEGKSGRRLEGLRVEKRRREEEEGGGGEAQGGGGGEEEGR